MTPGQAATIAGSEGFFGAQLSELSDGALVFSEWIVGPDGTMYPREQYPSAAEYTVAAAGGGSDWADSIGNALATGVQTFSTTFSRLLNGQQGINPATGLPYAYGTGLSPLGGLSGGTMLMIGGVILVFVLMKGRGGSSSERSPARSAPREHHEHHDRDEHRERHRKNPLQIIPGYATNRRRRSRRNARVKFYGAFSSRAKAESKARAVGGTLKPFKVHGAMRYGVMKRA